MGSISYETSLRGRDIRVIQLEPGRGNAPLVCSLQHVSLDGKPAYDAISYCWGGQTPSAPIICNGASLLVTQNPHDGPRQFRSPYRCRSGVWADAICINQVDIQEKNAQAPLMGSVYGQANHVKVWLGPASEGTGIAMELFFGLWLSLLKATRRNELCPCQTFQI